MDRSFSVQYDTLRKLKAARASCGMQDSTTSELTSIDKTDRGSVGVTLG